MIESISLNQVHSTNNGIASFLFLLMASRRSGSANSFVENFSDNAGYAFARRIKSVDKKHQLPIVLSEKNRDKEHLAARLNDSRISGTGLEKSGFEFTV